MEKPIFESCKAGQMDDPHSNLKQIGPQSLQQGRNAVQSEKVHFPVSVCAWRRDISGPSHVPGDSFLQVRKTKRRRIQHVRCTFFGMVLPVGEEIQHSY